jgi:hypothetical protein
MHGCVDDADLILSALYLYLSSSFLSSEGGERDERKGEAEKEEGGKKSIFL